MPTPRVKITCHNRWTGEGPYYLDLVIPDDIDPSKNGHWWLSRHRCHEHALKQAKIVAAKHKAEIDDQSRHPQNHINANEAAKGE